MSSVQQGNHGGNIENNNNKKHDVESKIGAIVVACFCERRVTTKEVINPSR